MTNSPNISNLFCTLEDYNKSLANYGDNPLTIVKKLVELKTGEKIYSDTPLKSLNHLLAKFHKDNKPWQVENGTNNGIGYNHVVISGIDCRESNDDFFVYHIYFRDPVFKDLENVYNNGAKNNGIVDNLDFLKSIASLFICVGKVEKNGVTLYDKTSEIPNYSDEPDVFWKLPLGCMLNLVGVVSGSFFDYGDDPTLIE